jgi:hypothetical protein
MILKTIHTHTHKHNKQFKINKLANKHKQKLSLAKNFEKRVVLGNKNFSFLK